MTVDMERVQNIVSALVRGGLIEAITGENTGFYVYDWMQEHKNLIDEDFQVYNGACKGVLVFDDTDWVIKFDYYGSESYCKTEANNYADAVGAGLAHYFAETRLIAEYESVCFVVQERCNCSESDVFDSMFDSVKRASEEMGTERSDDDIWAEVECTCEDGEGYLMFDDVVLNAFMHHHYINDMHQGNFGRTRTDGRMVMTDYSGF